MNSQNQLAMSILNLIEESQMNWDIVFFVYLGGYLVSNSEKEISQLFLQILRCSKWAGDGVYDKTCSTLAPNKSIIVGFSFLLSKRGQSG